MEMVASVKMQKAIKSIQEARSYVQSSWNMLVRLANLTLEKSHPLLNPGDLDKIAIIFVSSDRGLCGSYNADLYKKLLSYCSSLNKNVIPAKAGISKIPDQVRDDNNSEIDFIAIGKKGAEFIRRHSLGNLTAVYDAFDNDIEFEDIIPISKMTNGEYLNGNYSRVVIIYANFVSSLRQIPVVKQILPIDKDHIDIEDIWANLDQENDNIEFKIEPSPDAVIEKLLRRFVRLQVYGAVLEANASEHSSRMVAMKNATDNAGSLIGELTLLYNTIRQNSITNEIAEISAGAESMR